MIKELAALYEELTALDLPDEARKHTDLEAVQFRCAYNVKKLPSAHASITQNFSLWW